MHAYIPQTVTFVHAAAASGRLRVPSHTASDVPLDSWVVDQGLVKMLEDKPADFGPSG